NLRYCRWSGCAICAVHNGLSTSLPLLPQPRYPATEIRAQGHGWRNGATGATLPSLYQEWRVDDQWGRTALAAAFHRVRFSRCETHGTAHGTGHLGLLWHTPPPASAR